MIRGMRLPLPPHVVADISKLMAAPGTAAGAVVRPARQARAALHDAVLRRKHAFESERVWFWEAAIGLTLGAHDAFVATCVLVSDSRGTDTSPGPFPVSATAVARTGIEALGNLMSLCESPEARTALLRRDGYREKFKKAQSVRPLHAEDPARWNTWLTTTDAQLRAEAHSLRLTPDEAANKKAPLQPGQKKKDAKPLLASWPNPAKLVSGEKAPDGKPWLSPARRAAFKDLYDHWYGEQSRAAHQKDLAIQTTLLMHLTHGGDDLAVYLRNDTVWVAMMCAACAMTELVHTGRCTWGPCENAIPALRKLWAEIVAGSEQGRDLWRLRYRYLLEA